jgi:hypothetical protein
MSAKLYLREIFDKFKMRAAWPPNAAVRLGDIGIMDAGQFLYRTSLREQEILFRADDPGSPASYKHMTEGAVSLTFKANGQAPIAGSAILQAAAGVTVGFSREDAVYFQAEGAVVERIADQGHMELMILDNYRQGLWNRDWVVVTEVVRASACTVLISGSRSSVIELEVAGPVVSPGVSLADLSAGVLLRAQRDMATSVIAATATTPLFLVRQVRKKLLRSPALEGLRPQEFALVDWEPEVPSC